MQVADALSRCENPHSLQAESPTEEDPYFPYITDKVGEIELPGGQNFAELFRPQKSTSNDMSDNDIVHTGKEIPIVQTTSDSAKCANSAESTNEEKTDDQNHIDLCNGVKDMAKVKNEQRNDFEYKHIITYLEDNQLHLSQKHARRILLEAPDYILIYGVLYRNRKAKSERNKSKSAYQLADPHKMIDMILFMIHDSPLGGHSGIQNTLDRLRDNFYFPRMGNIVTDYDCQSRKVTNLKTKAKIVPYRTPSEPFQKRLDKIRNSVKEHSIEAQVRMEKATNAKTNELELSVGDYVYLQIEQQGQGRKFKQTYDGPFVVTNIPSEHLILLRDPNGKRKFKQPVHINRLKLANIREPNPTPYFRRDRTSSLSHNTTEAEVSQSDILSASQGNYNSDELHPQHANEIRRSSRKISLSRF
ncbi:unnamed protein product [Mytilus coruscus]|uniref:Integrase zinc-binding domain-containing protein n=1 Tax=Mytilus coruscus TaxID=42192 RepID=A0A6J8E2W4_MYTCO|nr:unnamed protein product [Mytilus coruscus]